MPIPFSKCLFPFPVEICFAGTSCDNVLKYFLLITTWSVAPKSITHSLTVDWLYVLNATASV